MKQQKITWTTISNLYKIQRSSAGRLSSTERWAHCHWSHGYTADTESYPDH